MTDYASPDYRQGYIDAVKGADLGPIPLHGPILKAWLELTLLWATTDTGLHPPPDAVDALNELRRRTHKNYQPMDYTVPKPPRKPRCLADAPPAPRLSTPPEPEPDPEEQLPRWFLNFLHFCTLGTRIKRVWERIKRKWCRRA